MDPTQLIFLFLTLVSAAMIAWVIACVLTIVLLALGILLVGGAIFLVENSLMTLKKVQMRIQQAERAERMATDQKVIELILKSPLQFCKSDTAGSLTFQVGDRRYKLAYSNGTPEILWDITHEPEPRLVAYEVPETERTLEVLGERVRALKKLGN